MATQNFPADTPQKRLKVVYILGMGHSGSTLVDMIIGTAKSVVSVGELIFLETFVKRLPVPGKKVTYRCTCGEYVSNCNYWSKVLASVEGKLPRMDLNLTLMGRLRQILRFTLRRSPDLEPSSQDIEEYRLLSTVLSEAPEGTEFICDSSKDFSRFQILANNPLIELYPIFLVRDVRGVAYSYNRKIRTEHGLPRRPFYKSLILWIGINIINRWILFFYRRPYLRIDYAALCKDPSAWVEKIRTFTSIDLDADALITNLNETDFHNINGNIHRFQQKVQIREDKSWQGKIPVYLEFLGQYVNRLI